MSKISVFFKQLFCAHPVWHEAYTIGYVSVWECDKCGYVDKSGYMRLP